MITDQDLARTSRRARLVGTLLAYAFLTALVIFALAPIAWAFLTSFKSLGDIYSGSIWPETVSLRQYERLFAETRFSRWMLNTLAVAVGSTLGGVAVSALAGYAFAKYDFVGKRPLFVIVLASIAIPPFASVVPMFGWMARLGWIDTYRVLILPFTANALGVFLMTQYIRGIPTDLLDSARIDGCGEFRVFWQIVLPVMSPAIGATAIVLFLNSWNMYIWPLVMVRRPDMFTLPVGLSTLNSIQFVEYGMLMAGAILSIAPIAVLFLLLQRQFVAGLTQGAVKG